MFSATHSAKKIKPMLFIYLFFFEVELIPCIFTKVILVDHRGLNFRIFLI
jgi:hypothetical protein